jgi:glycerate kinase
MTSADAKRVLVAPTAFKGTLGPCAAARAMGAGVVAAWPGAEVIERPLSDGGNGLLEAVAALGGGSIEEHEVTGPTGRLVGARLLRVTTGTVIESAEACGLHLIPAGQRNPLRATTRGVGELIRAAIGGGGESITLGLGGSGTVDAGTGLARALGWRFLDAAGRPLAEGGGALADLHRIEGPAHQLDARVVALCDVENPLLGPRGAAAVYGPQKGAGPPDVERLEAGLARLAQVLEDQSGLELGDLPGAGAAGGMGAGALAFLGAELVGGAEWMIERARIRELLGDVALVVTGEGRYDAQSGMGKLTGGVLDAARSAGVPVVLVCGSVEGPLPEGVEAVDGGGRTVGEEDVTRLTLTACRALAGGDTLGGSGNPAKY